MFKTILSVINGREFELSSMLKKIDRIWLQGQLTDSEKDELCEIAREKAKPENSLADKDEQIRELTDNVRDLIRRVAILEAIIQPTIELDEDFPPFVSPKSELFYYMKGDGITFRGKKYKANRDYVCWSPDDFPAAWDEVQD